MFRLFLCGLTIFIFFIPLGIPLLLLFGLLGFVSPKAKDYAALWYLKLFLKVMCLCAGAKHEAIGLENIPKDEPVLFVSNHRSYFDIFICYQYLTRICGSVAKIEWMHIPLLKEWMQDIHCIFLDRSTPRAGVVATHQMIAELEKGHAFWIYPEGTRNHTDTVLPFKEGAFRSAFQTEVPIIPVTFVHTDDAYELHRPFVRPTHMIVHFGEPIPTAGLDRAQQRALAHAIQEQIQTTYEKLV